MTSNPSQPKPSWAGGERYEPYVGRWSRLVAREFVSWLALPAGLAWLDVGCGTGLCGPLVREWAGQLAGCDLSAGMLRLADQRLVYDQLEKSELVAYLRARPEAFDVVISADTLCYFGVLAEFADAAFGALRGGGRLVFTVEALSGDGPAGYRLLHHGRYAHAASYLSDTLSDAGFVVDGLEQELLRNEAGLPVRGWLVSAVRPETG